MTNAQTSITVLLCGIAIGVAVTVAVMNLIWVKSIKSVNTSWYELLTSSNSQWHEMMTDVLQTTQDARVKLDALRMMAEDRTNNGQDTDMLWPSEVLQIIETDLKKIN